MTFKEYLQLAAKYCKLSNEKLTLESINNEIMNGELNQYFLDYGKGLEAIYNYEDESSEQNIDYLRVLSTNRDFIQKVRENCDLSTNGFIEEGKLCIYPLDKEFNDTFNKYVPKERIIEIDSNYSLKDNEEYYFEGDCEKSVYNSIYNVLAKLCIENSQPLRIMCDYRNLLTSEYIIDSQGKVTGEITVSSCDDVKTYLYTIYVLNRMFENEDNLKNVKICIK